MGSRNGIEKVAAKKAGVSVEEWIRLRAAGQQCIDERGFFLRSFLVQHVRLHGAQAVGLDERARKARQRCAGGRMREDCCHMSRVWVPQESDQDARVTGGSRDDAYGH